VDLVKVSPVYRGDTIAPSLEMVLPLHGQNQAVAVSWLCPVQKLFFSLLCGKQLSLLICPPVVKRKPGGKRPQHLASLTPWAFVPWLLPDITPGPFQELNPFTIPETSNIGTNLRFFSVVPIPHKIDHMDAIQRKRGFSKRGTFIFGQAWDNSLISSVITE
jgi:hypothetical protein